ncbi:hypothetical protein OHA_2_00102 (plasmid) [Pleomorphomonas sp. SM30]|uniref:Uncharacterized protein n=1 Tax=Oharaeibacter diazotrophicus TaxID=1920512 RepID=A0A4R6R6C3_9HYPH|nr:hypothetical protein EDD54_4439 [Oharaeibacter diazotrophicus]BBE74900.1 hypothetical protein OHA_2_00102 [Pleomorphomonas sp. SM30]
MFVISFGKNKDDWAHCFNDHVQYLIAKDRYKIGEYTNAMGR